MTLGALHGAGPSDTPVFSVLDHSQTTAGSHDPVRRALLVTLLAAYVTTLVSPALAAPSTDAALAAFLAASKLLTGRPTLESEQASRLFGALTADDPQFPEKVQALASLIDQRKIDPLRLQQVLDAERSELAALPRDIVTAWYVGVVGDDERARCITFETSLMNVIVSDRLKPPSYCYGVYGSWAQKPT
ncbi:sorbitol dehydrogenase family protein [Limobrevibacterium gyesilva]|uniref:Sorbitol dehydrogenase family protein n=1 Tax=Limobrevibacterium gyesilva TaxID=2991712 RepID=A0AA41YMS9_9PROT|nr:sorbitol dehydrogenase family protein [Limobrevibacterium gyesilva]MCW3474898.1 sorbitol dehydrogenase family protein [Limobrevibacterium gyesilva]